MHQPIHTVYGGAHLFKHDVAAKLGRIALRTLQEHRDLIPATPEVLEHVAAKLARDPVEDYRIDFEDGYGYRSDDEEDRHAEAAAEEVLRGMQAGTLPAGLGIRIKALTRESRARAIRTLDCFFDTLRGEVPDGFVVCLPKASSPEQLAEFQGMVAEWGEELAIEFMVETPEALRSLTEFADAAGPRCRAVHFGPYDFTASCGIVASAQGLRHPLCDYARSTMLVALAGRNLWLSDGPTATLPAGSRDDIQRAWLLQWHDIRHALSCGFFQGWDLHPAQIALRYAAVFTYFQEHLPQMQARLENFRAAREQATRAGAAFDDAATARGLENFFQWERFFLPESR
jgi:citrate lyase beta subunit